jgi:Fe-S oxidoreductase
VARVAEYLRRLRALFDRYDYHPSLYGHFGQGCVHCRVPFDLYTADGVRKWHAFMEEATDLVVDLGGSFSGEHGDGQSRAEFLPKLFGPELMEANREFKRIWDPDGMMNPHKVMSADGPIFGLSDNLRLGPDYAPPEVETHFAFAADQHSFARAALRCVGIGECRREAGGVMCPSYMVTHEEMHSTRGRARLLYEMLNGELLDGGWKNEHVKEALDLCLSCKGCKAECPVNVDMATYKAEFLSHYYEGRLRPRHAYAFGWIHRWARLARFLPAVANFVTHAPGLAYVAKRVAGMDGRREAPRFAPRTFRSWFADHVPQNPGGPRVVLFPDTFNDHFHPEVARAATEVLEASGFFVEVPTDDVCCGRPLYDYGFLDAAKKRLVVLTHQLAPYLRDATPIVVLEPSCWAVFKDELVNLLPNDEDAKRLSRQVHTLGRFLADHADHAPPRLAKRALLHGHCHQSSLEKLDDKRFGALLGEKKILADMGVEVETPSDGCCGMAGAFGFEAGEHCDVSLAAAERSILPHVRERSNETIVIADGFSCHEQVKQCTDRHPLHLAQVLQLALRHGPAGPPGRPEDDALAEIAGERTRAGVRRLAWLAGFGALAAAALLARRRAPAWLIAGSRGRGRGWLAR